ncbi:homeodomain-like protein [Tanacetum coccineum]
MPLSTYLNLRLGELVHTKLTVELAYRTVKYPKGIAENVLVGIGKFTFPIDFIILDMPEDIKVPLILGRPFFLRERMELDLEVRLMGETLVLSRLLDPFLEDYIELNDLNGPFKLRRNQGDDLMPTIKEGEVIEEFRTRDDELDAGIDDYPSYCDYDKKIHIDCAHNLKLSCMIGFEFIHANFFTLLYVNVMSKKFHNSIMKDKMVYKGNNVLGALMNVSVFVRTFSVVTDFVVLENMDDYRDEEMSDVIFGEPFLREVRYKARWFKGMITIYNGDDEKASEKDEKNGISHAYQKLKGFYKGVLNLGPDYIRDAKMEEWLTHGHISVHEMGWSEQSHVFVCMRGLCRPPRILIILFFLLLSFWVVVSGCVWLLGTYYDSVDRTMDSGLKIYSFDELKELFETTMKNVNTFVPMETEDRGRASELAAGSSQATIIDSAEVGSSKRAAEAELDHEGSKRQKTNEASGSVQEQPEEEEKELSQEDLQQMMMVVPVEEVYVEALQVKYPIIDWEVYTEESRKYWKIIRVGNHTEAYQFFEDMLKIFDRDDLVMLWNLVKERFSSTEPTDDKERTLWVELKRLFEPNTDDTLWKLQRYMHDPLKWRLYDTCGVHHVSTERGIDIFMLVEKEYPLSKGVLTLMLVNRLFEDYALWDVIENGNSFKPAAQTTTNANGSSTTLIPGPITADEKTQKKNDVKERSMLLMALPNEHLLTFNQYKDAKTLFPAIQTRFGSNDATKKTYKTLLKQMYENFSAPSTESLDSIYNKLQKIKLKELQAQAQAQILRTWPLYHPLAVLMKLILLMEFVLLTLKLALLALKLALLVLIKITINGSDTAGYDKSKVECFNCYKLGHFARECKGYRNQDNKSKNQDSSRRTINVEEIPSKAMLAIDGADSKFSKSEFNLATYKRGLATIEEQLVFYKKKEVLFYEQLVVLKRDISYKDSEISVLNWSQIPDKSRKGLGFVSYNDVPPSPTGLFSPPNLDLSNSGLEKFQQPEFEGYGPKTSKSVSEDTAKINFITPQQQEKPFRKPVKYGYIKNHKKIVKNGQVRTRERKSVQNPEAKPERVKPPVNLGQQKQEAQVSLSWIASLAIRVRSLSDPTAKNKDPMIG